MALVLLLAVSDLKYIYLPEMEDAPIGYEHGMLCWMDMHPEVEWARDRTGRFGSTKSALMEDGTYDISFAPRTVNALIKKGWVEATGWTERMAPTRIIRSEKPGIDVSDLK